MQNKTFIKLAIHGISHKIQKGDISSLLILSPSMHNMTTSLPTYGIQL